MSGKLYYDLLKERTIRQLEDSVALVRVEELSPFPYAQVRETLSKYTHIQEVNWIQEEPRNTGAWNHVQDKLRMVLEDEGGVGLKLKYLGRKASAVPATGVGSRYKEEQNALLDLAFGQKRD